MSNWGAPLPPVSEYQGGGGGGGTGDVVGPGSSVGDNIVLFNGTTGKRIKDAGVALSGLATASAVTTAQSTADGAAASATAAGTAATNAQAGADASVKKAQNGADFADIGSTRHNLNVPALSSAFAVATSNVASLSGLQTIDGQALTDGQRVLLTAQTTASQNGPWLQHAGAWTRPTDYPAAGVISRGRIIEVTGGTIFAGTQWMMTTNAAVTIDSDATSWNRTTRFLEPSTSISLLPRDNRLASWYQTWDGLQNGSTSNTADVLIIGDSITVLGGVFDKVNITSQSGFPWPWRIYKMLYPLTAVARDSVTAGHGIASGMVYGTTGTAIPSIAGLASVAANIQGTDTEIGTGGYAKTLTNGQTWTFSYTGDSFALLWRRVAGGGTLAVADEDGVMTGSGFSTAGSTKSAQRTDFVHSGAHAGYATHTVTITSTGTNIIEVFAPFVGNRTKGLRVWNAGHAGYSTQTFIDNPDRAYDLIDTLGSSLKLIINATGYNDADAAIPAAFATHYANLASHAPGVPIVQWVPWKSNTHQAAVRLAATTAGIPVVDFSEAIGTPNTGIQPVTLSGDGVHPNNMLSQMMEDVWQYVLTGDPYMTAITANLRGPRDYNGGNFTGDSLTVNAGNAGTGGIESTASIFGLLVHTIKGATSDANTSWTMYSRQLASIVGIATNSIAMQWQNGIGTPVVSNLVTDSDNFPSFSTPLSAAKPLKPGHLANLAAVNATAYAAKQGAY